MMSSMMMLLWRNGGADWQGPMVGGCVPTRQNYDTIKYSLQ